MRRAVRGSSHGSFGARIADNQVQEARILAIGLPDDIAQRLDAVAKATGRSKESYLREAIVEYLGDLEDFPLAEQRLAEIRDGRAGTFALGEVERDLRLAD